MINFDFNSRLAQNLADCRFVSSIVISAMQLLGKISTSCKLPQNVFHFLKVCLINTAKIFEISLYFPPPPPRFSSPCGAFPCEIPDNNDNGRKKQRLIPKLGYSQSWNYAFWLYFVYTEKITVCNSSVT